VNGRAGEEPRPYPTHLDTPPAHERTSHSSAHSYRQHASCLRCGAHIPEVLGWGNRTISGFALHEDWHLWLDWRLALGLKAPLYAAAGFTLDDAIAAETSETPPTSDSLRVLVALLAPAPEPVRPRDITDFM
jgi:hypothetical protein